SVSASESTLLRAPRGLNEPVFWRLSTLRRRSTPARSEIRREASSGVRWIRPAMRRAAASMSASGIMRRMTAWRGAEDNAPGSSAASNRARGRGATGLEALPARDHHGLEPGDPEGAAQRVAARGTAERGGDRHPHALRLEEPDHAGIARELDVHGVGEPRAQRHRDLD